MQRTALPLVLLAVVLLISSPPTVFGAKEKKALQQSDVQKKVKQEKKPANRVVVMYFHRTKRCPTCKRMGSYSEEAVKKGFAKQVKNGTIEFHYVDFQNKKNVKLTKGYKIRGPALIVAKIVKNKVMGVRDLKEIWTKNRDKKVFFKYVQDNIVACQKPAKKPKLTAKAPGSAKRAK